MFCVLLLLFFEQTLLISHNIFLREGFNSCIRQRNVPEKTNNCMLQYDDLNQFG